MEISIRKFAKQDMTQALELCEEIREHHRQILNGYFAPLDREFEEKSLQATVENDNTWALVAVAGGQIIGLLIAEKKEAPYLEKPRTCNISSLIVAKNFRKHGVGKLLMDAFLALCREAKIQEIKLGVFNDNTIAYNFYLKYGFKPLEQKMSLKLD